MTHCLTGAHAIVLQGKGSGGYVEPVKTGDTTKTKAGSPTKLDDVDTDVDSPLLYEYDIKTPLYSPKLHLPLSGQPSLQRPKRFPLRDLIPACVKAVAELGLKDPPLIVAAGGISTGNDIWQCMKLGDNI